MDDLNILLSHALVCHDPYTGINSRHPSLTPAFTQEPSSSHTSLHTNTHTRAFLLSHQPSHKHTHKSLPSLTHFLLPLFLPSISGPLIFFPLIRSQTSFLFLLLDHLFFFMISSISFISHVAYPIERLNGDPDPSFFVIKN
jgi:hypothetical protein